MYRNQLLTEKLFVSGLDKDLWYLLSVIYGLNCFLFTFEGDNLLFSPNGFSCDQMFSFDSVKLELKQLLKKS